ncbi:MAG TPA: DinB family protein [Chitinophagaceae bacterium]
MNKETQSIIRNLQNTLSGEPWFGRALYPIMEEVDASKVYTKPKGTEHSLIELLYHMITWATFCLLQLKNSSPEELKETESLDWRELDPKTHTWKNGMTAFKEIHKEIVSFLETKNDELLSQMVKGRKFNYRFMLNGLIQHNIYHLGQVAYVKKLLA